MNNRLNTLFEALCKRQEQPTVDDLARRLGVSTRTVYNDVDKLNSLLGSLKLEIIANNRGTLSYPCGLTTDFSKLLDDEELLYIDPELRRSRIAEHILMLSDGFSIDGLLESYEVSRNTLLRDMRDIREMFLSKGVSLESKSFVGYVVRGDEAFVRNLLASMLFEDRLFFESISEEDAAFVREASRIIDEMASDLLVEFSEESVERLVCTAYASWKRVQIGKLIPGSSAHRTETKELAVAKRRSSELERLLCTKITSGELSYIADKLKEASVFRYDEVISENWIEMNLLVSRFIEEVSRSFPGAGFEQEDALYEGLLNHLRPAYWRAVNHEHIDNPMLGFVTEQCAELHEVVSCASQILDKGLGVIFQEGEVAYFTLFFAASLERSHKVAHRRVSAIVVCREGISTSQILKAKLYAEFDLNVVGVYSVREARSWLLQNHVDVVITTVPFRAEGQEVIEVEPQILERDRKRLRARLGSSRVDVDVQEIIEIVERYVRVDEGAIENLSRELKSYLGILPNDQEKKGRYQPMLKEVLTRDLIEVGFAAEDRDAAVREAGRLLVDKGFATEGYVDGMIENVEVNGTYIVIAPGIAMPHARPEKGAKGIGFSVITLAEPVVFGHPTNDPVKLVIALCAVDHQTHLKALSELADILADETKVRQIEDARSADEIANIIEGSN